MRKETERSRYSTLPLACTLNSINVDRYNKDTAMNILNRLSERVLPLISVLYTLGDESFFTILFFKSSLLWEEQQKQLRIHVLVRRTEERALMTSRCERYTGHGRKKIKRGFLGGTNGHADSKC